MSLPDVKQTQQDFGLGQVPASAAKTHAKIGVCSVAPAGLIQSWAGPSLKTMTDSLGYGPLAEAAAYHRQASGGPLVTCAATASQPGVAGSVSHSGTGVSTMSASGAPVDAFSVQVKITRSASGLAPKIAAFQYSLDGGNTYSPETAVPSSGSYAIPGAGLTVTFTDAAIVEGDVYAFACTAPSATVTDIVNAIVALSADPRTWGWLHIVGASRPSSSSVTSVPAGVETPPAITLTGTPSVFVDAIVKITLGGIRGTATFQYSLDNGVTYNGADLATAAIYLIPGTGLTLNLAAGTYVLNEQYTFNTYGGIAALFAAIDAQMTALAGVFRYSGAILELPDASDAILLKATASLASAEGRVMYSGGYCDLISSMPVNGGAEYKRPDGWVLAARRAASEIHEDLGKVLNGSLPGVVRLYRDENVTPAFGAARIATLRTITGLAGFYAASDSTGDMMSVPGSDFNLSQRRTVMDAALATNRAALLPYLNSELDANAKTGMIKETTARAIEHKADSALARALINGPGGKHAVEARCSISRTEVITQTNNLSADVSIIPFGYTKSISVTVHYSASAT